jgi:hypothetical protein
VTGLQIYHRRITRVFSDDGVAGDTLATDDDEEEDGMVMYCQRWRTICLMQA